MFWYLVTKSGTKGQLHPVQLPMAKSFCCTLSERLRYVLCFISKMLWLL